MFLTCCLGCIGTGCAHVPHGPEPACEPVRAHVAKGSAEQACSDLQRDFESLASTVRPDEAAAVASVAVEYPRILAREYRLVRPALLQNFLVNLGMRERGLCYQWAEDLLAQLRPLRLRTLELHWGIARPGSLREHNCLVITAGGQPFECGIVLDAWRHSGRLYWSSVRADSYGWEEGQLDLPAPVSATANTAVSTLPR